MLMYMHAAWKSRSCVAGHADVHACNSRPRREVMPCHVVRASACSRTWTHTVTCRAMSVVKNLEKPRSHREHLYKHHKNMPFCLGLESMLLPEVWGPNRGTFGKNSCTVVFPHQFFGLQITTWKKDGGQFCGGVGYDTPVLVTGQGTELDLWQPSWTRLRGDRHGPT